MDGLVAAVDEKNRIAEINECLRYNKKTKTGLLPASSADAFIFLNPGWEELLRGSQKMQPDLRC